jgi:DNA repair photolyase
VYPLRPNKIYAHEALRADPDAMVRLDRFLTSMARTRMDVDWYVHEEAARVSQETAAWRGDEAAPQWKFSQPIVFTRFACEGSHEDDPVFQNRPQDVPLHNLRYILGYMPAATPHHTPEMDAESCMTCWPAMFLASADGCPHGCVYCGAGRAGKALVIALNVEEYLEQGIRPVLEENPWQKCFLMMGSADIAALEPEYGLFEDYLNLLAEYEDRYGYCHTNGDNVDWVRDLTHRERLIAVWSLCSNEAAELLEPCAPSASSRIDAMARLCAMGVPVRVKLKPVLPIRGWRESYGRCLEELLTRTSPETLGFASIIWMDYERLCKLFPTELLDLEFVEAARLAQEEMKGNHHGPFPHAKREELYRFLIGEARRHSDRIPLFVSTETPEMWDALQDVIGQNPRKFLCGCNPVQGPGPRHLSSAVRASNYATNKEAQSLPLHKDPV